MPDQHVLVSRAGAAKVAGAALLVFTVLSLAHFTLVEVHLVGTDAAAEIAELVRSRELLLRVGIVTDLFLFATGVVAFVALFVVLRHVDEGLAVLGLAMMVVQAALVVVVELSSFLVLLLFGGRAYAGAFTPEQAQSLAALVLDTRAAGYTVALLFFALGWAAFCSLFLWSADLPRGVAVWGLLSFLLVLAATALRISLPEGAGIVAPTRMAGQVASVSIMLFQVTVGSWLVVKGVSRR